MVPALGVVPPSASPAHSSTRPAPPAAAASADSNESTHASTRTPRAGAVISLPGPFRVRRKRARPPCPARDGRDEVVDPRRREVERPSLLGARVGRHQQAYDVDAVVEGQQRLLLAEEGADEVPVLVLVAVRRRLVGD